MSKTLAILGLLTWLTGLTAPGPVVELHRSTVDGGGTMFATGSGFELSGTVGQPDAGPLEGGGFTLTGGFWFEQGPLDCNYDGGVTICDYDDFNQCAWGPDGTPPSGLDTPCTCFDLDADGDVDLRDFGSLQMMMGF